jgi:hypothetical protein
MNMIYKLAENKTILSLVAVLFCGMLLAIVPVNGQAYDPEDPFGIKVIETGSGTDDGIALGNQDFRVTITNIINVALSLLGIVAVVVILIGGFKWMTAGGNDDQVGEARKWIFSGIIGLAIILSAWAIARFALTSLGSATNTINEGTY